MGSEINTLNRVLPGLIEPSGRKTILEVVPPPAGQSSFSDLFSNALNSVNELQQQAGQAQGALLAGEPVELHEVMIQAEQAGLAMDLLLEVRNRMVNGINELMRMPI